MDGGSHCVVIGASESASITFSDARRPFDDGYEFVDFSAEISAPGLSARSRVRSLEGEGGLGSFLDQLATDWRGWEGARSWIAIEHDLSIDATADRLGHVRLAFTLRETVWPDAWTAGVVTRLDAGEELKSLASAVADLLAI